MAYMKYSASASVDFSGSRVLVEFAIEDVRGVPAHVLVVRRRISSTGMIGDAELLRVASLDDLETIPWRGLKASTSLFLDPLIYEGVDKDLRDDEIRTYDEDSVPNSLVYRARKITVPYYDGRKLDAMIRIYPTMLSALYNDYVTRMGGAIESVTVTPGTVSAPPMSIVLFSATGGSGVFDWELDYPGGTGAEIRSTVAKKLSRTGKSTCKVYTGFGEGTIRVTATDRHTKMKGHASLSIGSTTSWDISGELQ